MFDSLFDDLLIARWRGPERPIREAEARVTDLGDRYEVRFGNLEGESGQLDIEATERRLVVRSAGTEGGLERIVDFRHPVDAEVATAELSGSELKIILPKKRARKINVG